MAAKSRFTDAEFSAVFITLSAMRCEYATRSIVSARTG